MGKGIDAAGDEEEEVSSDIHSVNERRLYHDFEAALYVILIWYCII